MRFYKFINLFFFWTIMALCFSVIYDNWDRISLKYFGPPEISDLDFNKPARETNQSIRLVSQDEEITTRVFEQTHEAVVNIAATTLSMNFWRQIIPKQGQGTGFIIDDKGYILTNNHVVENANEITVTLGNGKKVEAVLVGRDPSSDLAVIKIPQRFVPKVAKLGDSNSIKVGQKAIAIGNPFGLSHTLTTGIISALNRQIENGRSGALYDLIQTDTAINPGNSGGPLLNSSGEVIGINTAIFSVSGGYQGIGFAIPVNRAKMVATQLITKGRYAKPWLGISGVGLNSDLTELLKLETERGVLIAQVAPGGPAFKGDLKGGHTDLIFGNLRLPIGGDIITSINNKNVSNMEELVQEINRYQVGDSIKIKIWREGRILDLEIVLEESPA